MLKLLSPQSNAIPNICTSADCPQCDCDPLAAAEFVTNSAADGPVCVQVASILLPLCFLYDVFWVFIQPMLTKGGTSVMIEVSLTCPSLLALHFPAHAAFCQAAWTHCSLVLTMACLSDNCPAGVGQICIAGGIRRRST